MSAGRVDPDIRGGSSSRSWLRLLAAVALVLVLCQLRHHCGRRVLRDGGSGGTRADRRAKMRRCPWVASVTALIDASGAFRPIRGGKLLGHAGSARGSNASEDGDKMAEKLKSEGKCGGVAVETGRPPAPKAARQPGTWGGAVGGHGGDRCTLLGR